jgi:hypothetical protein
MKEKRNAYGVLVGKPEGKRPPGRHRSWLENNIKMNFQEIGCCDVDWIHLAQDRDHWQALVDAVMNLLVASQTGFNSLVLDG